MNQIIGHEGSLDNKTIQGFSAGQDSNLIVIIKTSFYHSWILQCKKKTNLHFIEGRVQDKRPGARFEAGLRGVRHPLPLNTALQFHHRDLGMYMILSHGQRSIIVNLLFYFVPQVKISSAGD